MTDSDALAQLSLQAASGSALANFYMGTLHDPSLPFHPVNAAEPLKAIKYYRMASDLGIDTGTLNLALLLSGHPGFGVNDPAEARRLLKQIAPVDPAAIRQLGFLKKNGLGEPPDLAGGMRLLREAADKGDHPAQRMMGSAYDLADCGFPRDAAQAVAWFEKAALGGDALAERQLGMHYKMGDGVTADLTVALDWFKKAAAQGDFVAQRELTITPPLPEAPIPSSQ